MLSPVEDFWLRWHVEHSSDELAECARLVLQAEAGGSPLQAAGSLGPSTQAVAGVLAKFEHDRLGAFPRASLRLTQLIQLDSADAIRRQNIARSARRLFNDTRPLHHLPRKARQLLEAAALLPPVTQPAGGGSTAKHVIDLLDGAVLADYNSGEQATLSCVLRLQSKGYRADRDVVFRRLRPTEQSQVRHMAALLQVAALLDHSGTQSTTLEGAELQTEAVVLRVTGSKADTDGAFACRHAWLWQPVFHLGLEYAIGPRPQASAASRQADIKADRDEPVGAVFGRQMTAALRKWQASLPGAAGTDASGLADLLLGVSQARAALGAFSSVLKRRPLKEIRRPLRTLHALLVSVVEQQNALSDLEAYCSGRPQAVVADLQPLREAWERAGRRRQLAIRAVLDSEDTARLYTTLSDLAQTPPMRRRKSTSIRVAAPVLLDELCAEVAEREQMVIADQPKSYQRYQQCLARLECALEALAGKAVMGEAANQLLADVQRLEGRIDRWLASNALNDAVAEFLDSWAEQQARRKAPQLYGAQLVLAYRQARRAQWSRLRSSLPDDWRPVRAGRLRRRVNTLLKQLERH
jgi:hypothetical protein